MISILKVRKDLKEIKYYYSRKKEIDSLEKNGITNSVYEVVKIYNEAIRNAPIKLYDLYASVYIQNNTLGTVAYDWNYSEDYIKHLNIKLCKFFSENISL